MIGFVGYLLSLLLLVLVLVQHVDLRRRRIKVADAAHEVRGSLTVIGFGLHALNTVDSAALKLQLARGANALNEMASVTGRVIRVGQAPSIWELLDRIVTAWRPVTAAHGRVLKAEFKEELRTFSMPGQEVELAQTIGNLISNAIDHGRGTIEISAVRIGKSRIEFAVADQGERWSQLSAAPYAGGLRGRGLAIVERIVRRNGGQLRLDLDRPTTAVAFDAPLVEVVR